MFKIIIINYNSAKWISKCLQSIGKNLKDTIIVDNNSKDNSLDFILENYPMVTLIKLDKNIGFGQANNIGIQEAYKSGAEFVFLLNQDVYLSENCIEDLILISKKNKEFAILSPIHLNGSGNALDFNFSNYINPNQCNDLYSDKFLCKNLKEIYEISFVNAAAWLITRECIENVGGFNPTFFHYGEDNNYCDRVTFYNYKIGVVPNIFIYHDREKVNNSNYFSDIESEIRLFKLKYSNPNIVLNKFNFYIEIYRNILKNIITFNFEKVRLLFTIFIKTNINTILKNKTISINQKSFLNLNEQ